MPKFLTAPKLGVLRATAPKGAGMQVAHDRDIAQGLKAAHASHPNAARLGQYLHPKKGQ